MPTPQHATAPLSTTPQTPCAESTSPQAGRAAVALLLLVPAPTVGVLAAMYWFPDTWVGQGIWSLSKLWLLMLPWVWWLWIDRGRLSWSPLRPRLDLIRNGMLTGILTGIVIFMAIVGSYLWLGKQWMDHEAMREQAMAVGLKTPMILLLGAIYWSTVNAALEEYVWRWFVYFKLEALLPQHLPLRKTLACTAAGAAFTFHHVLILMLYFDWRIVTLSSLGVFIGGVTWSALYAKYRSVWPGYISHAFADVAIMLVTYWVVFGS